MTTTQANEITHEQAVAIDTMIGEAYGAWMKAKATAASAEDNMRRAAGQRPGTSRHMPPWRVGNESATLADAEATLTAKANDLVRGYSSKTGADFLLAASNARQAATDAGHEYLVAERQYKGWSRFFMVQGGHIHATMLCSTCNHRGNATQFGWLPELSGLTETEAVAAHGPTLCTVCFPSAPVEWTTGSLNANGEYVAPKTYCAGSNTSDYKAGSEFRNYAGTTVRCTHCHAPVKYGNNGMRKHQTAKAAV